jgi:hypothetical protein
MEYPFHFRVPAVRISGVERDAVGLARRATIVPVQCAKPRIKISLQHRGWIRIDGSADFKAKISRLSMRLGYGTTGIADLDSPMDHWTRCL